MEVRGATSIHVNQSLHRSSCVSISARNHLPNMGTDVSPAKHGTVWARHADHREPPAHPVGAAAGGAPVDQHR